MCPAGRKDPCYGILPLDAERIRANQDAFVSWDV